MTGMNLSSRDTRMPSINRTSHIEKRIGVLLIREHFFCNCSLCGMRLLRLLLRTQSCLKWTRPAKSTLCHTRRLQRHYDMQMSSLRYAKRSRECEVYLVRVLESSSDMGKIQMAFNLMTHVNLNVLHLVCAELGEPQSTQPVYTAFGAKSGAFLTCVELDVRETGIGEAGVSEIASREKLYTYGLICTMLAGDMEFAIHQEDRSAVLSLIASRKKEIVIFLDEFPLLPSE